MFNREELPYRQGAIAIVIDKDKRILLTQLQIYDEHQWRFPGGGIEKGETAEQAVLRELTEELGSDKFKILKKCRHIVQYEWPDDVVEKGYKKRGVWHRGQQQTQFLVEYFGTPEEINIKVDEVRKVKWVNINNIMDHMVFPHQKEDTDKALKDLGLDDVSL